MRVRSEKKRKNQEKTGGKVKKRRFSKLKIIITELSLSKYLINIRSLVSVSVHFVPCVHVPCLGTDTLLSLVHG